MSVFGDVTGLSAAWAIFAMMVATYLCRASGVVLMSRVRITRRVERALRALPGCIVMATIVPIAADGGAAAILGLGATILVMAICKIELVALAGGLGVVTLIRALGL
ncbi:MAG: AzlD domain-containing protein [Microvirga sp.]|jgi:uncharacterized membrane protein